MGGQLDGIFLAGSLPHEFIILIVTLFICLWLINFSLSLFFVIETHTTVYRPFVRDYPGRPVPEETFTFTHSHPSSSDSLYQLPPSTTIYNILLVQFTWLTVLFHHLVPCLLWSSSWSGAVYFILYAFLHPVLCD